MKTRPVVFVVLAVLAADGWGRGSSPAMPSGQPLTLEYRGFESVASLKMR